MNTNIKICDECGDYGVKLTPWVDHNGVSHLCDECHPTVIVKTRQLVLAGSYDDEDY